MVTLPARRTTVSELHERRGYSERQACSLVSVARASYRYKPETEREDEGRLRKRIKELACCHKRYGCPRITVMLRREEWVVNKKRVHRIWKEECLQVQRKLRRKRRGPRNEALNKAEYKDHVWCWDFILSRQKSTKQQEATVEFLTKLYARLERVNKWERNDNNPFKHCFNECPDSPGGKLYQARIPSTKNLRWLLYHRIFIYTIMRFTGNSFIH